jgi:hypothetical protein
VADLALDVGDVEVGGEQHGRDVGASQGVRRDLGEGWQPAFDELAAGVSGDGGDDVAPDVVLVPAGPRSRAEQRCGWCGGVAVLVLQCAVGDQLLSEGGGDLDVADAGFALAVGIQSLSEMDRPSRPPRPCRPPSVTA